MRPEYAAAADRYLERFVTHCTDTRSGLFPWGEHALWDLKRDCLGNSRHLRNPDDTGGAIHDHLRQAPLWLWEKIQEFNPFACSVLPADSTGIGRRVRDGNIFDMRI